MDLLQLLQEQPQAVAEMISQSRVQVFLIYDRNGKVLYASPGLGRLAPSASGLQGSNVGGLFTNPEGQPFDPILNEPGYPARWHLLHLFASDIVLRCSVWPAGEVFLLAGEILQQGLQSSLNTVSQLNNELANLSRELRGKNQVLSETEQRLRKILDTIQTGVMMSEFDSGLVRYANPAALVMLGADAKSVRGRHRRNYLRQLSEPSHLNLGELGGQEAEILRSDGTAAPVVMKNSRLSIYGQEMLLDCFLDVSHLKRAYEESLTRRALQSAIETAGAACHEFNQPLQAIMSIIDTALEDVPEDSPIHKALQDLMQNTEKLAEVTQRLSRITSYKTVAYGSRANILDLEGSSS